MNFRYKQAILFFFAVEILLYVLYYLRYGLLVIFVAALIAIMVDPLVEWFQRHHLSRGGGVGLVALALTAVLALIGWLVVPRVLPQVHQLQQQLPIRVQEISQWMNQHLPFGHFSPESVRDRVKAIASGEVGQRNWLHMLEAVAASLLLGAYFSADKPEAVRWLIALFPAERQGRLSRTLHRASERMQHWIFGQAILMLVHGLSALIAFSILGLDFYYVLAIFAGLVNFIPVVGPVITLIVAGTVAALQSTTKLIGVAIFYIVYHNTENIFVTPRVMRHAVRISAAAVVAALVIGDVLAGVVGMLISVPTAVLVKALLEEYVQDRPAHTPEIALHG